MNLDYSQIEFEPFEHFKGGEGTMFAKMFFDGTVRILRAYLPVGASIGYHQHVENCEIIYILSGKGTVNMDGVETEVAAGMSTYCEKGHFHSLTNTGTEELHFFGVVPEVR